MDATKKIIDGTNSSSSVTSFALTTATALMVSYSYLTFAPNIDYNGLFNEEYHQKNLYSDIYYTGANYFDIHGTGGKNFREFILEQEPLWSKIPTYSDYVDIEALYDIDEVEKLLFDATKHLGW